VNVFLRALKVFDRLELPAAMTSPVPQLSPPTPTVLYQQSDLLGGSS